MPDIKKTTLTVESEADILALAKKIEQNRSEDQAFSEKLDAFLNNAAPTNHPFVVGSTSNALHIAGAKPLDVVINPATIAKCMADEATKNRNAHGLSREIMGQLPKQLRNPIMIFSGSRENTLVAITELRDKENREIMIAVALEQQSQRHEVHKIASIYGRDDMTGFLQRNLENQKLIACNQTKADEMLQSVGLHLPLEETFISFDDSIAYSTQNVKREEAIVPSGHRISVDEQTGMVRDNVRASRTMTQQEQLQYTVDTDIALHGAVQPDTLAAFRANGYDIVDNKVQPVEPGDEPIRPMSPKTVEEAFAQAAIAEVQQEIERPAGKINPDYYKSLAAADRHIETLPVATAQSAMRELAAQHIPYSAVQRGTGVMAVTVSKENSAALQAAAAERPVRPDTLKINPDYYKSLPRNDRSITPLSETVAKKAMSSLDAQQIPYSAVQRTDGIVAVTVCKSQHLPALRQAVKDAETVHKKQLVHPEVYHEIPKEERFTKRMTQPEAQKAVADLEREGIRHSAVLDGEKSGVTVEKKNGFFLTGAKRREFGKRIEKDSHETAAPQREQRVKHSEDLS